ncbi:hypothetical protein ABIB42_004416 [Massilia sp. UYP32]|uniref:hypothetical protein n=1 Tax=Massilia TaxID=149698 RepID=UPI000594C137|nr:hypothetical protein [Massilia timonae]
MLVETVATLVGSVSSSLWSDSRAGLWRPYSATQRCAVQTSPFELFFSSEDAGTMGQQDFDLPSILLGSLVVIEGYPESLWKKLARNAKLISVGSLDDVRHDA